MIPYIRTLQALIFSFSAVLSSQIYAIGLYDAYYENNLLKIPLIKVGDVVYEVTMIREESAELARLGCTEFCFRLASAEIAKDYASSIYAFYDASTSTATIDNLWFESRVYKVSLKNMGVINGGQYFNLVNADQKRGLPVYLTSYENKVSIRRINSRVPILQETQGIEVAPGENGANLRSLAFADFLQNGTHSAIIASTRYVGIEGNINKGSDAPAKLYFISQNEDGSWKNISDQLFTSDENRYTCASPSYIEVADFNNDGRPDVVMSCMGPDFMINGIYPTPYQPQVTLLSRPDGKYDISSLGVSLANHQLAAADFNNDGNIDVIGQGSTNGTVVVFWGKGDGTFIYDDQVFPSDMKGKSIFGVRAIPINGRLSVLISGNPSGTWPDIRSPGMNDADYGSFELFFMRGAFQYRENYSIAIPSVDNRGLKWGLANDVLYRDNFYYFLRVSYDNSKHAIVKTNRSTGESSVIYEFDRNNWTRADTSGVITFDLDENIVQQVAGCSKNSSFITDYFHYTCYMSVTP
jgi:hypothetical protein